MEEKLILIKTSLLKVLIATVVLSLLLGVGFMINKYCGRRSKLTEYYTKQASYVVLIDNGRPKVGVSQRDKEGRFLIDVEFDKLTEQMLADGYNRAESQEIIHKGFNRAIEEERRIEEAEQLQKKSESSQSIVN